MIHCWSASEWLPIYPTIFQIMVYSVAKSTLIISRSLKFIGQFHAVISMENRLFISRCGHSMLFLKYAVSSCIADQGWSIAWVLFYLLLYSKSFTWIRQIHSHVMCYVVDVIIAMMIGFNVTCVYDYFVCGRYYHHRFRPRLFLFLVKFDPFSIAYYAQAAC